MTHGPIRPLTRLLLTILMAALGVNSAVGQSAAPWVIPPGQDALLSAMLEPADLPPGVVLASARVDRDHILARYEHKEGASLSLRLVHPSTTEVAAGWQSVATQAFQLQVATASPPTWQPQLLKSVRAAVGQSASQWRWQRAQNAGTPQPGTDAAEPDKALQVASDALLQGRHAATRGNRQDALAALGRAQAALADAEGKPEAWHFLEAALIARASGDDKQADAYGQQALERIDNQNAGRQRLLRARALLALGRFDAGEAALKGNGGAPECAAALAIEDLRMVGQPDRATALARRIVAAAPRCSRACVAAAQLARHEGTLLDIADLLQGCAAANPTEGAVLVQLANLRMRQGQHAEALKILETAARTKDLDPSYLVDISHIYTTIEPPDDVVDRWLKRAADDNDHAANFLVGVLLHYRYRWEDSDRHLARAEPTYGNETRLLIYRAMNRHRLGDREAAIALIERASGGVRPDPDVRYCRGVILLDVQTDRAIADLQAYLEETKASHEVYLPKQERVQQMLLDLRDCRDAKVPSECVATRKSLRQAGPWAAMGAALLGVLLVLLLLWRRRRAAALLLAIAGAMSLAPDVAWAAHPRTLLAQWSWLGGLEQVQILLAGALWLAALAFFFVACRSPARPGRP